jgi:tripartite-type tricarboxylate transporter receptor subunit TctC
MPRIKRQTKIHAVVIAAVLMISTAPSDAQPWPQRPVQMIVPVAPGSSPDVAARVFAERLGMRWGKAVTVENRPGADGLIGTAAFAAAHDDHVLLFSFAAPITVYPVIQEKLSYDPVHDLLPVAAAVETFGTISIPASLPITTLSELVTFARSRPGQLNWATGGGAFPILMAGFIKSAGLEMVQVPYRNQNLAIQDMAEGRIQVFATPMTAILPSVQAGKIRVLAVTNKKRSPLWPDIPTATESGYPDLAFEGLIGVFAPRGTPDDRRERISADIRAIAADQVVAKRLGATGQIVRGGSTPAEFAADIEEQRSRISGIVRLIGKPPQ